MKPTTRARSGGYLSGAGFTIAMVGATGLWGRGEVDGAIVHFIIGIAMLIASLIIDPNQTTTEED